VFRAQWQGWAWQFESDEKIFQKIAQSAWAGRSPKHEEEKNIIVTVR